jgi:hypothetical protein
VGPAPEGQVADRACLAAVQVNGTVAAKVGYLLGYLAILHVLTFASMVYSTKRRRGT